MVALPALVGAAAAVGTTRRLTLKAGWWEPSVLWGMVVAQRGSKKTPALKSALRPVYELQSRLHGPKPSVPTAEPDDTGRAADGEISCQLENRSVPGHIRRVVTTDVTVAGLADILESEPRGILVVRDELAGWFGDLRKHASRSDSSQWLSAWSAEPWILDRRDQETIIPAAAVSIIGGIQPGVLSRTVTVASMEAGLFDRFLFVVPPPPAPDCWTDACEDAEDKRMMDLVFSELYRIADCRDLGLDRAAKDRFAGFVNTNGLLAADADEAEAATLSKFPRHVARIAMTLQLMRWAAGDASQDAVDDCSMKAAIDLASWFAAQSRRAIDLMSSSGTGGAGMTGLCDEEAILAVLRREGLASVRDLQRRTGRRFGTSDQVRSVVERLVVDGRIREVPDTRSGPGPRTTRYESTG